MSAASTAKAILRRAMKAKLKTLSHSDITLQSRDLTAHLLSSEVFQNSQKICCYLSISGEIDTWPLALEILRLGKTLFVPHIVATKPAYMKMLRIYNADDLFSLSGGIWGIKEPDDLYGTEPREEAVDGADAGLDLILLPGVAFDNSFARLGHGKGYYDQYLTSYHSVGRRAALPRLFGLALQEQMVPAGDIPMTSHDWKVDTLVSSQGLVTDQKYSQADNCSKTR